MAGVALSVTSGQNWAITIPNAKKFLGDPMIDGSLGGLALFDYASVKSWPSQSSPNLTNQKWINLINNSNFPHLWLGDGETVEGFEPSWSNGFVFDSTQSDRMSAPSSSALNFTTENWFISAWVMLPSTFFSVGGIQMVFTKRQGDGSYGTFFANTNTLNSSIFVSSTTEVAAVAYTPTIPFATGTLYQIVQAVRIVGSTVFNDLYVNGKLVATASTTGTGIASVPYNFKLGSFSNNSFPGNLIFLRLYAENTTLSTNNQADRIAYEWAKVKDKILP